MATADPRDKAQRAREDRFDRFLDVAETILDEGDEYEELGDEPDDDGGGTEAFGPNASEDDEDDDGDDDDDDDGE